MRFPTRFLAISLVLGVTFIASFGHAGGRLSGDSALGAENHPKILAKFGGEIESSEISSYVNRIGRRLVPFSDQPLEEWSFTVLDTPVVNAFATPGGYIYVTRGLLALANDQAELAAVLAHEISHVTANHIGARQNEGGDALRSGLFGAVIGGLFSGDEDRLGNAIKSGILATLGHMSEFSQEQEFQADKLGVKLLIRAGYDPYAQADFLDHLAEKHALESLISGKEYNPNSVEFLSSHPATGERVREAIRQAERSGQRPVQAERQQARYFEIIDGMVYGDSASQGFVRGRRFFHPELQFAFKVPEGFVITNTTSTVKARGGEGTSMILSAARLPRGSLTRYISDGWAQQIGKEQRIGALRDLRSLEINGLNAATALLPIKNGRITLRLTVIEHGDKLYRISGGAPSEETETLEALFEAAQSFKALQDWEVGLLSPYQVIIHKVKRGDTVQSLANSMPFDSFQIERFRTLNGLEEGENLQRGDLVKLILD